MRFLHATILNQVNPYLQFKMKKGTVNLSFLDFMTTKTEIELWMNIYSKSADSKAHVSFSLNHLRSRFNNILFF